MQKARISGFASLIILGLVMFLSAAATQAQTFTVLYNFGSALGDAQNPWYPGVMAQGRDGSFDTTSSKGGQYNMGTVFHVTLAGQLMLMYNFGGTFISGEGAFPTSGLELGIDGNFYGAAYTGGAYSQGTVFKITPSGTLTQLHDFTGGDDGGSPMAPPIQATDGNFYGTTYSGGASRYGTVYKITAAGKFSTLHTFVFGEGNAASAPLVQGTDGLLYGTTSGGGANGNLGTVFKITTAGKLTVLYSFDSVHGLQPVAPLVQGSDGSFYGTALQGSAYSHGVVYKITSVGRLTVLHNFCAVAGCADGANPSAGLVQDSDGNFYGVAGSGGTPEGYGTLYKITPSGAFSVVHTFDLTTGWTPVVITQHTNGILYGAATGGGSGTACGNGGCGTFYSLDMGLKPFVSFLPQQSIGKIGASVGIFGQGFNAATNVLFGGTPATFTVSSDTYLTAIVPSGALTGPVTVATPGGNLTTRRAFRVLPQIKSISPTSGPVGANVQITGASFSQIKKVTFGGVTATAFTIDSDTQITATVPTGAKTGKIGVTGPGGTAVSATTFTVTP